MKKWIALLLIFGIISLTACGGETKNKDDNLKSEDTKQEEHQEMNQDEYNENATPVEYFTYEERGGIRIKGFENSAEEPLTEVIIPSVIDGKEVTYIEDFVKDFDMNSKYVEKVVIPDTVTAINDEAFFNMEGLTTVVLSKNLTWLGREVFKGCEKLENINIEECTKLETVNDEVFYHTGLVEYTMPETIVQYPAIYGCARLKTIKFHDKAVSIENIVHCDSLEKIVFPDHIINAGTISECPALTEVVLSNGMEKAPMIRECPALTSLILPDTIKEVTPYDFAGCENLSVTYKGVVYENVGNEDGYAKLHLAVMGEEYIK